MFQANVGDGSSDGFPVVPLDVPAGATVTVAVVSTSTGTLTVQKSLDDSSPTTIAPGNNSSFTTPMVMSCPGGVASIQVTGGNY